VLAAAALVRCDQQDNLNDPAAKSCYDELIKQYPETVEADISLSRSSQSNDNKKIEADVKKALMSPSLTAEQKARLYIALSYAQYNLGQKSKAIESATNGLALGSGISTDVRAWLYINLSYAQSSLGLYPEAIKSAQDGLALGAGVSANARAWLYKNLSWAQGSLSQYSEAIKSARDGLALGFDVSADTRAWLYINLSFAQGVLGQNSEAIKSVQDGLALQGISSSIRADLYNQLAWVLYKHKDYDSALKNINESIKADPQDLYAAMDTLIQIQYALFQEEKDPVLKKQYQQDFESSLKNASTLEGYKDQKSLYYYRCVSGVPDANKEVCLAALDYLKDKPDVASVPNDLESKIAELEKIVGKQ
jgi:hypothetical protein